MFRTAAHLLITAFLASTATTMPAALQSAAAPIGRLEFSKRLLTKDGPDSLTVRFPQYDHCVCKVSTAATIWDTVHFEVVFHYAGLSDTMMLVADKYGTIPVRKPSRTLALPGSRAGWTAFDVTGKRRKEGRSRIFTAAK